MSLIAVCCSRSLFQLARELIELLFGIGRRIHQNAQRPTAKKATTSTRYAPTVAISAFLKRRAFTLRMKASLKRLGGQLGLDRKPLEPLGILLRVDAQGIGM